LTFIAVSLLVGILVSLKMSKDEVSEEN